MDNPNITMKEYIRLEEEKAQKCGKVFNWETAKYGKIWCDEDVHDLRSVKTKLTAIVFNDELSSEKTPTLVNPRKTGLQERIWCIRMLMEHRDDDGVMVFTSQASSRVLETRGPLIKELILEILNTLRFGEVLLNLDTSGTIQFQLGGATTDLVLRLFHRMMTHSIAGRSQAPEKMTMTDLFYLRGLDVGSVNIPYLLAIYLRRFAAGWKSRALVLGGQFICVELEDTWAWVPARPARREGDAGGVAEEAPVAPGGGDEDEEMPQAVLPPPRTQGDRIARLEEEVHSMREVLQDQREVLDSMARDFFRFTMWTVISLSQMMDKAGVTYTRSSESPVEYQRRNVRSKNDSFRSL
nr:hypothetical protein [Tanacetum cinerariifolium]